MRYWVTAAVTLVYLVLVWFFAGWLNPPGSGVWVLRIGLWLLGLLGAAFTAWWLHRLSVDAESTDSTGIPSGATTEVDLLVRDAVRKLKSSSMGRGASLRNLPLIFVVGDPGSAKTTTIIHSALDPELLAGHVYQDNAVVPTRVANFWYTRQAVFVDGGGGVFSQPDLWKRLIKLVQPGRVASAGKQQQAPRAAIVCFDCEGFLRQGAPEATLSAARRLGTRLLEISQLLGISFPIYVLFTRADRIGARADGGSAFLDYVAGLSRDEATQVLGVTLPVRSLQATGVYADEETRRLEKAFDELFYSLSEKRIDLLSSAGQADKLPGIYEFPRELRKLRKMLVQFLVDLARPSQLNVNPFLRGFYFAGVRPTVIEDVAAPAFEAQPADAGYNANATVVFGAGGMRAPEPVVAQRVSGSRRVPEWVFLSQLFNEVLLKDRVALSASGFSSRVSLLRRIALASVTVIALIFAIGFLTSFIGNFFLERTVKQAIEEVKTIHTTPGQTPTVEQLQKLDNLRKQVEQLSESSRHGAPWSLRWWMYSGDDIYPATRQAYFDGFNDLLFAETEKKLLTTLQTGKEKPSPTDSGDQYQITYNDLRAYLITTKPQDAKYSTRDFLSPVLLKHWREGRAPDDTVAQLASTQFDFYSTELAIANPYSLTPEVDAIARAQDYLAGFTGIERYYFPLLEKARTAGNHDISFRSLFPSDTGVIDSRDTVRAAFTHDGFALVQTAINAPTNQMSEEWVLGKGTAEELEPAVLRQKLKDRYDDDFIQTWRNVVANAHIIISSTNPKENAARLDVLAGAGSPILEFLWFVSHNTAVDNPDIANVFASVQGVVAPAPDKGYPSVYKLPSNQPYTDALSKLREDMSNLANSNLPPSDTHLADQANASAEALKTSAEKVAGNQVDEKYHVRDSVVRLLKEPAIAAQAAIGGAGKVGLNAGGRQFCQQLDAMRSYFPFNPNGPDLPLDQLNAVLGSGPNSALQTFYSARLAQFMIRQGSTYVANDSAAIKISPQFVSFFRQVKALSDALYPNGSPTLHVEYTLKQVTTNVDGLTLKVGNDSLAGTGQQKTFTWTGAGEDVLATQKDVPIGVPRSGPWSIFHFISDGKPVGRGFATYDLEFVRQSNGQDIVVSGKKQSYSYELRFSAGNPWGDFAGGLRCVAQVTR
ncbi:MAG TPA: ImcF-related family protein [Terriglobales bacterium]|nr:ImcF-related family protein [Terriglobales bacterium]